MTIPIKSEEKESQHSMEERLSRMGARIDSLIDKAIHTRTSITHDIQDAKELSAEVLDELKESMDKAWSDVNHAWDEIRAGAERTSHKLHSCKDEREDSQR